jgi:luciferase family oxidoreductase group 1
MAGSGMTMHHVFEDLIASARRAEELGFARYWMAEHHGAPGVASSAPAITVGALAAATSRIHVGTGGVMLPNHIPLVVAEQFGTLASLYPGRIDLGVGRGAPDPQTAQVLARSLANYGGDDFAQSVAELSAYLTGESPDGRPYRGPYVAPRADEPASVWVLGASTRGAADLAAKLGVPFAFAHHFGRGDAAAAFEHYRRNFRPSRAFAQPHTIVTALTVVAPTDAEAVAIAASADLMFAQFFQRGRQFTGGLPSPEEAAAHTWSADERAFAAQRHHRQAIGSPETVQASLTELLARTGADELMATMQIYRLEDRIRSLELLAAMSSSTDLAEAPA